MVGLASPDHWSGKFRGFCPAPAILLKARAIAGQVCLICDRAGPPEAGGANPRKGVLVESVSHEPLNLGSEALAILSELLRSEHARLLIEIRHTHHRVFRDQLRLRLDVVEELVERCRPAGT